MVDQGFTTIVITKFHQYNREKKTILNETILKNLFKHLFRGINFERKVNLNVIPRTTISRIL
jgi:hypothetical protein